MPFSAPDGDDGRDDRDLAGDEPEPCSQHARHAEKRRDCCREDLLPCREMRIWPGRLTVNDRQSEAGSELKERRDKQRSQGREERKSSPRPGRLDSQPWP